MTTLPDDFFSDAVEHNHVMRFALEEIKHECPELCRLFYGTRFQLPASRQQDYPHHANASFQDVSGIIAMAGVQDMKRDSEDNDSLVASFFTTNVWASLGMPTLFLEKELAEALMRTDLPQGFSPSDLHWRRNAFRLFLPRGLFVVKAPQRTLEPTCLTVARHFKDQVIPLDPRIRRDLVAFRGRRDLPFPREELASWSDRERVMITLQMRPVPEFMGAMTYYCDCPLEDRELTEIEKEIAEFTDSRLGWNLEEKTFLTQVKHLVLNCILFMGSIPQEYEAQIIRPGKEKKGQFRAEIRQARFLGQEMYRPSHRIATKAEHEHTGRRLPGHWRAGHWKRQAYGPGHAQRKLIWVQPYRTLGLEETESAA